MNIKKFGFSKELRLQTPAEFQAVFLQPIRSSSRYFTVLAAPNEVKNARLGIIVAKRNVARAIDRNRIRRLIREQFRNSQSKLMGLDIVVLARCNLIEEDKPKAIERLKKQWDDLLKQRKKES